MWDQTFTSYLYQIFMKKIFENSIPGFRKTISNKIQTNISISMKLFAYNDIYCYS